MIAPSRLDSRPPKPPPLRSPATAQRRLPSIPCTGDRFDQQVHLIERDAQTEEVEVERPEVQREDVAGARGRDLLGRRHEPVWLHDALRGQLVGRSVDGEPDVLVYGPIAQLTLEAADGVQHTPPVVEASQLERAVEHCPVLGDAMNRYRRRRRGPARLTPFGGASLSTLTATSGVFVSAAVWRRHWCPAGRHWWPRRLPQSIGVDVTCVRPPTARLRRRHEREEAERCWFAWLDALSGCSVRSVWR